MNAALSPADRATTSPATTRQRSRPPSVPYRVALVQIASPATETNAARFARVETLIREHSGVQLFVLPELWLTGYFAWHHYASHAETLTGATVRRLQDLARECGAAIHLGSIVERRSDGALRNTAVLILADGTIAQHYSKIHLFGYESAETQLVTPGTDLPVTLTPFGAVSSALCYDLRFPGLWQQLSARGAETAILPAAWPAARLAHWRTLTQARAIEHQLWVFACNGCGTQTVDGEAVVLGGHSRIIAPNGEVIAECGGGEEVLIAEIDPAAVAQTRNAFPVLNDRLRDNEYAALGPAAPDTDTQTDTTTERVIRVSAIVLQRPDGRVLTVRKRGTQMLMLPGGKPEPGETALTTALREFSEELGIPLRPEDTQLFGVFRAPAANEPGHTVEATVFTHPFSSAYAQLSPCAEIEHCEWVDPREIRNDTAPLNRDEIFPRLLS